ncbi:glycosyltransferase [Embleya sp. NPDC008237]|uniref:glycosyltransferase n=1 Tax=Embleya sp. NPDC008237 TaxID=3363978 RepID=UPI0036E5D7A0
MSDRDSAVAAGVAIPDARQAAEDRGFTPPARLRRLVVTHTEVGEEHPTEPVEGAYVLRVVPAETVAVTTSVEVTETGVVRSLRVPVDPVRTARLAAARAAVEALDGGGVLRGLRRIMAQRDLEAVRRTHRAEAERDAEAWARRCEQAYEPYLRAFAADAEPVPASAPVLGIGPTNTGGQGHAWARAVERHLPGVRAEASALSSANTPGHPSDQAIATDDWLSTRWQLGRLARVLDRYTHVLAEGGMPAFGRLGGSWVDTDLAELRAAGISLGLVLYGSEARDPAAHRARVEFSPFDPRYELTHALQAKVDRLLPILRGLDVPTFVATPDLIADVPDAVWLPAAIDPSAWRTGKPVLARERPVVVHVMTSPFLRGTARIEPTLHRLHEIGLIEYRRILNRPAAELPALFADADIVLDQFGCGSYGMTSCQALAAGRLTICYLHESATEHLPADLPIRGADPNSLAEVLEEVVAEPEAARELAARGPAYVAEHHDGRRSARVLADFLGVAAE